MNKTQLAKAVRDVASDLLLNSNDVSDEIGRAFNYLADLIEAIDEDPKPEVECKTGDVEHQYPYKFVEVGGIRNIVAVMWNGIKLGEVRLSDDDEWIVLGHRHTPTRYATCKEAADVLLSYHRREKS